MNPYPDFLIIGAMKCATSTLHKQLALQPGLFMSRPKELHFFSHDVHYRKGIDWYLSFFRQAPSQALCGESSTSYSKLPDYPFTVDRIKKHFPNLKFIYAMRHPIDRLISHFIHEMTQKTLPKSIPISRAINATPRLVEYGFYARQLEPYLRAFGKDKILPLFSERLKTHPQEELERICRFIGYRGKPAWNFLTEPQNISERRLIKIPVFSFFAQSPSLHYVRRLLPQKIREKVRSRFTADIEGIEIPPEQLDNLKKRFDDDLKILGFWLGTVLNCDNFKKSVQERAFNWIQNETVFP